MIQRARTGPSPWLWAERPTWQVRGDRRCHYSRVCHPALGGPELPAAGGGFFDRDFHGVRGQWRGPSAGRWTPDGGLRGVA
jgi:hypothetical protein